MASMVETVDFSSLYHELNVELLSDLTELASSATCADEDLRLDPEDFAGGRVKDAHLYARLAPGAWPATDDRTSWVEEIACRERRAGTKRHGAFALCAACLERACSRKPCCRNCGEIRRSPDRGRGTAQAAWAAGGQALRRTRATADQSSSAVYASEAATRRATTAT